MCVSRPISSRLFGTTGPKRVFYTKTLGAILLSRLSISKPFLVHQRTTRPISMPTQKRRGQSSSDSSNKKVATSKNGVPAYKDSKDEEEYGIVQREFYPPEMTNSRALQYNNNEIPRPIEILDAAIAETESQRDAVPVKDAVIHWYKCDLRMNDNKALHMAAEKAKSKNVPLICMYIISPQDFQAHITSPPRVDFILRTLQILKEDLAKLDIPLYVQTFEKRKTIPGKMMDLWEQWGVSHVYANIEYEVDELRREALLTRQCLERGIAFTVVPDTCVIAPGELSSQQGKQYAVYSPWYRAWLAYMREHPEQLDPYDAPGQNPGIAREKFKDIFDKPIPEAPENKRLNEGEKKRFKHLWPAGEHEAIERLNKFLDQKIGRYKDTRNFPAANTTAVISVHHAAGTLSARTSIRSARDVNSTKKLDGGHLGIVGWISEVAWRDFVGQMDASRLMIMY